MIARRLCRLLCGHSKINPRQGAQRGGVKCYAVECCTAGWVASSTGSRGSSYNFQLAIFQAKLLMAKRERGEKERERGSAVEANAD